MVLFAYHNHSSHLQHLLSKKSDCHTCVAQIEKPQFSQALNLLIENTTLDTHQYPKRVRKIASRHDALVPNIQWIDFEGLHLYQIEPLPLGYDANAPPFLYS